MGAAISAVVQCITHCHDWYNDCRWNTGEYAEVIVATRPNQKSQSIFSAVSDRNVPEVRRLLREDAGCKSEQDSSGETAMHHACRLGHIDVVEALIEGGCPVDTRTDAGTPLHCALKAGQVGYLGKEQRRKLLTRLVTLGCAVNSTDKGLKTALFCAAEHGDLSGIQALLALGAGVNQADANQFTPLYMAVIGGDLACVRTLLRYPGIDLNAQDTNGRTPLMSALITITNSFRYDTPNGVSSCGEATSLRKCNRIAVVEALLAAGADASVTDVHGRNALVLAFTVLEQDSINQASLIARQSYAALQVQLSQVPNVGNRHEHLLEASKTSTARLIAAVQSIYVPLVRLMILTGAGFPEDFHKDFAKAPHFVRDLHEEIQTAWKHITFEKPAKLTHLCRLAIRSHLANVLQLHNIALLSMPPRLRDYLEIRYI